MNTPLLEVSELRKHFPIKGAFGRTAGAVKAVDSVSFTLQRGTTLGLVGESGCGKSTTGKVLMRLLDPTSGSIKLDGQEISSFKGKELNAFRRRVQMVFQNPASSLNPRMSIGAAIASPMVEQGIRPPGGVKAKVHDLMDRVGLRPEHANRFPHEFSGGQRQRIGIARALALDPDVVICDEPVSALDVSVQAQVVNLLKDIQRDTGISYIFIAHDLAVVKHMADEVAVMYLGKIMEQGPNKRIFADARHPYTRALLSAVPSVDLDAALTERIRLGGDLPSPSNPPSGCVFRTRCPAHALLPAAQQSRCASEVPVGEMACHFPAAPLAVPAARG